MKETPYQFYITLNKEYYKPTEIINGTVHLKLLNSLLIDNITLKLTKQMKITAQRTVYTHKFNLFRPDEPYKISAGHHIYPFSFYLNANDNASIKSTINVGDLVYIENTYLLNADVMMHGVYMPLIYTQTYINVIDNNDSLQTIKKKIVFDSCFSFFKKHSNFVSRLNKEEYLSGEDIILKLECESKIESISIYMYQLTGLQDATIRTHYILLHEEEFIVKGRIAEIKIPSNSMYPSSASESFYDIKYILQVVVRFKRKATIQYKHDVFLIKREQNIEKQEFLSCLTGIQASMQFFTLD